MCYCLIGAENDVKREFAITRRNEAGRPLFVINTETRICNNCNVIITQEIQMLEEDSQCMRLNVISQRSSNTCLLCNALNNVRQFTTEIIVFLKFYIS